VRCPLVGVSTASCALAHPRPVGVGSAPCSLRNCANHDMNDCEGIRPRGVKVSIQRRLTLQPPQDRYGGGGARDRTGAALAPSGTIAAPGRPRPHPPLPSVRPTRPTNDGEGEAPRGVTPRCGPTVQWCPGARRPPTTTRPTAPKDLHSQRLRVLGDGGRAAIVEAWLSCYGPGP
jgi:hypothetical protein